MNEAKGARYPIRLIEDESGEGFVALHPDLPGCISQGATAEEAVRSLADARALWIEDRIAEGLPVPTPLAAEPSGRVLVRMPGYLHAQLQEIAQGQGASLNQILVSALSGFVAAFPYRQGASLWGEPAAFSSVTVEAPAFFGSYHLPSLGLGWGSGPVWGTCQEHAFSIASQGSEFLESPTIQETQRARTLHLVKQPRKQEEVA
ncbi:MAG: type II toxin-antitoxin system HicB family antitoxin [Vicinamibacteria bacterium]